MKRPAFKLDPALLNEITVLTAKLPPLPPVVRYFDDFANEMHSLRNLAESDDVILQLDGIRISLDFAALEPAEEVIKHVVVDWLQRVDPHTVAGARRSGTQLRLPSRR